MDTTVWYEMEWPSFMKKVLVTGAGGYIGRHVVKALCDIGVEVIADRKSVV